MLVVSLELPAMLAEVTYQSLKNYCIDILPYIADSLHHFVLFCIIGHVM